MRRNRVKADWENGKTSLNGWLHLPSPFSAELMAHQGWDSLTVDMQHGPVDFQTALGMLQAISTTETTPLVRVPWNDPGLIMGMLDAGCYGVICPMINTRADCEAFVGACRYPPDGYRSFGPYRARLYGGPDYAGHANENVLTIAMVETREAVENLEEILGVPGLDAVYVGPADLAQSLGLAPGLDPEDPRILEAMERILSVCRQEGVAAGIFTGSTDYASRMASWGFRLVTVQSDSRLLAAGAGEVVAQMQDALE